RPSTRAKSVAIMSVRTRRIPSWLTALSSRMNPTAIVEVRAEAGSQPSPRVTSPVTRTANAAIAARAIVRRPRDDAGNDHRARRAANDSLGPAAEGSFAEVGDELSPGDVKPEA